MSDLLLMTNADAANTLSIVAWVILFFILLNVAILLYTIIRNKRAAAKELKLQAEGPKPETPEKKEAPAKKAAKPAAKKESAKKADKPKKEAKPAKEAKPKKAAKK